MFDLFNSHSRHNNSASCHPAKQQQDETATSSGIRKSRIEEGEPPKLTDQLHEHQATIVQPSAGNGQGEVQKKSHHHRHHHHHRNHKRHPQVVDVVRESIESESAEISEHFGQPEPPVLLFPPWSSGSNGRHNDLLVGDRGDHESVLTSVIEHGLKVMKLGSTSCCQQIMTATKGEIPSTKQVAVVGDGKGKSARVECRY